MPEPTAEQLAQAEALDAQGWREERAEPDLAVGQQGHLTEQRQDLRDALKPGCGPAQGFLRFRTIRRCIGLSPAKSEGRPIAAGASQMVRVSPFSL
jgi:hypothetical protein